MNNKIDQIAGDQICECGHSKADHSIYNGLGGVEMCCMAERECECFEFVADPDPLTCVHGVYLRGGCGECEKENKAVESKQARRRCGSRSSGGEECVKDEGHTDYCATTTVPFDKSEGGVFWWQLSKFSVAAHESVTPEERGGECGKGDSSDDIELCSSSSHDDESCTCSPAVRKAFNRFKLKLEELRYAKPSISSPEGVELPPICVVEEDQKSAYAGGMYTVIFNNEPYVLGEAYACRERQLLTALAENRKLKELLREIMPAVRMSDIEWDFYERIKAAVTGE